MNLLRKYKIHQLTPVLSDKEILIINDIKHVLKNCALRYSREETIIYIHDFYVYGGMDLFSYNKDNKSVAFEKNIYTIRFIWEHIYRDLIIYLFKIILNLEVRNIL